MSNPIPLPETLPDQDGPLVSVIVPAYETDRSYITTLFKSIANQTYTNLELVLVDSSEKAMLKNTAAQTDWIQYLCQEPRGVSAGYNKALRYAEGEIISVLNDDDYFAPDQIERQLPAFKAGADIVYSDVYDVYENSEKVSNRTAMHVEDPDQLYLELFRFDGAQGNIPSATVSFRRECIENNEFDEELAGGEDYHLWVRLFKRFEPKYIDEPLAYMRQRDGSLSSDAAMMYENRMQAIEKLCNEFPELERYRKEREQLEYYDYGRQLLIQGETASARSIFIDVLREYGKARAGVLLAVSLFPFGHERIVHSLDELAALVI